MSNVSNNSAGMGLLGDSNGPCVLGYTNGTHPNGSVGAGMWQFGVYMPTDSEVNACQAAYDPWDGSAYYGWWTTYFILAGFAAIGMVNAFKRLDALNRVAGIPSVISFNSRLSALSRVLSYPQIGMFLGVIPAAGPSFWLFGFFLFSTAVCFGRFPYYRPPGFGSPPLALRSELIATAMVPWLYAFATRRNFVTYLSGISLNRMMTMHKYAPWICLYMSGVHTWSMIIKANRQQPWWYTWATDEFYRNGFIPLAALAWLCFMSLSPFRSRFYELFYMLHIIAAIVFLVSMYIHLANLLETWQYLHAATVLWGAAIVWRITAVLVNHGWVLKGFARASITTLPGDALAIRITVPPLYQWQPGSHVYIRFVSVRPWETHPFTIASLPQCRTSARPTTGSAEKVRYLKDKKSGLETLADIGPQSSEMIFLVKPQDGFTKQLQTIVKRSGPSGVRLACVLDGPYSASVDSIRACDVLVMIAGGSGISAIIPLVLDMRSRIKMEVHWAVKDAVAINGWFDAAWMDGVNVQLYATDPEDLTLKQKGNDANVLPYTLRATSDEEDIITSTPTPPSGEQTEHSDQPADRLIHVGRPNVGEIVASCVKKHRGRVGVVVCGPSSMALQVRNAVASAQKSLLQGGGMELELYEESYSS